MKKVLTRKQKESYQCILNYTLFMPTPHYKISIALGDAGILRIYPFCSNCLILEKADDVDLTPISFPNSRTVGMNKVYEDVVAEFRKDGRLVPIFFTWGMEENIVLTEF